MLLIAIHSFRNLCGKSLKESCRKLGFKDTDSFLVAISKDNAVTLEHAPGGGYQYSAGVSVYVVYSAGVSVCIMYSAGVSVYVM